MTAYLSFTSGTRKERMACNSVITIGRDKNNDVVLSDLLVSRNHAMVRRLGDADYYIIDSGSANGSQVNAQRIAVPTLLRTGDRITIGRTEFTFEQEARASKFSDSISFQDTIIIDSPVIKEITVLVADIRGFTSLTEQVPIQALTKMMNKWFHDVSNVIYKNGGTVDKFIGDCVFARWEDDKPQNNVIKALRTAWLVGAVTAGLSTAFPELPHALPIGAGINTGTASLGIGVDNTALGDAVNTAFRLESATKALAKDVALSESSYKYLPARYWSKAERLLSLKGKKEPVRVFAVTFAQLETILQGVKEG